MKNLFNVTFKVSVLSCLLGAAVTASGCQTTASLEADPVPQKSHIAAVNKSVAKLEPVSQEDLVRALADTRVIMIGERHDRLHHHLLQRDLIDKLEQQSPGKLVVAVEFFQQPFQPVLDAYIAGDLSEDEMLAQTEYFERWKFDYRLYAPIFRLLREKRIPLIALNVPVEVTRGVSRDGYKNIDESLVDMIPDPIHRDLEGYRERLEAVFADHPGQNEKDKARFLEIQMLWDEGMAQRAATALQDYPDHQLVILAGNGHIAPRNAIGERLLKRVDVSIAAVSAADALEGMGQMDLDYIVNAAPQTLSPAGKIGLELNSREEGLLILQVLEKSAAMVAGLKVGEVITHIEQVEMVRYGDLRIVMLDKKPADTISISVVNASGEARELEVTLQ